MQRRASSNRVHFLIHTISQSSPAQSALARLKLTCAWAGGNVQVPATPTKAKRTDVERLRQTQAELLETERSYCRILDLLETVRASVAPPSAAIDMLRWRKRGRGSEVKRRRGSLVGEILL
jgi:hypothetical protein